MGFLTGKKLLITGVLSNRSIAYGIAKACHREGAEIALSYVGERFKDRTTEFAADFNSKLIFDCDVGNDEQIAKLFTDLSAVWPKFDGFVHSIGFAPREAIAGDFLARGLSDRARYQCLQLSGDGQSSAALPERSLCGLDLDLPWLRPHCAQLQHYGAGQSLAGGFSALSGRFAG
jgi:enoyl-[acyl-carrier protein] reductase I